MKKQKPKQTQFNTSNTGVYPMRTHGLGVWNNPRVVMSVRVDEKLKKEATKVLKLVYGSTCRGIETYLAGLVATYEQQGITGVYPSNTSIGQIVIERNFRARRKLEVEDSDVERDVSVTCGYVDCERAAVAHGLYKGETLFNLCMEHFVETRYNRQWVDVEKF